jgi:ubiquitin carboxyl-terminal hydrolase L3
MPSKASIKASECPTTAILMIGFFLLLQEAAKGGQTEAPAADADIDLHFVAFVGRGGVLYELDGRKAGPVAHGPMEPEGGLLAAAAAVIKQDFVAKAESLSFSLMALAAAGGGDF